MEMLLGAIIFIAGLFAGMWIPTEKDMPGEDRLKDIYLSEYEGKTKGLYAPVKRSGKEV